MSREWELGSSTRNECGNGVGVCRVTYESNMVRFSSDRGVPLTQVRYYLKQELPYAFVVPVDRQCTRCFQESLGQHIQDASQTTKQFVVSCKQESCPHFCGGLITKEYIPIGCSIDRDLLVIRLECDNAVVQDTNLEEGPLIEKEVSSFLFKTQRGTIYCPESLTAHII